MGRKQRNLHELIPVKRGEKAYVWRSKWVYLGKWEGDGPSASAMTRLHSFKELWKMSPTVPPTTGGKGSLFIELWDAWKESPQGPKKRPEDLARVELSLFGTVGKPGPFAHIVAKDFRPSSFLLWQTALCERELSRWTVGQCRRLVLACFDWGSIVGHVDEFHPAALARVKAPAHGYVKEKVSRTPVPESDFRKAISHLAPVARAACDLLWHTGARPSELLGNPATKPPTVPMMAQEIVRTGSIRTAKGIDFPLPKGLWAAVRTEHKMKRKGFDRVLFFGKAGQKVLASILEISQPALPLFPTQRGQPFNHKSLNDAIERGCQKAKVPTFTSYQIRHGASVVAQLQFSEAEVGCFLGHKSRAMTGNYSGSDLRTAARVALEVG